MCVEGETKTSKTTGAKEGAVFRVLFVFFSPWVSCDSLSYRSVIWILPPGRSSLCLLARESPAHSPAAQTIKAQHKPARLHTAKPLGTQSLGEEPWPGAQRYDLCVPRQLYKSWWILNYDYECWTLALTTTAESAPLKPWKVPVFLGYVPWDIQRGLKHKDGHTVSKYQSSSSCFMK